MGISCILSLFKEGCHPNLKKMVEKVEKAASSKVSKPKKAVVASHPATSVMVKEAIENLKERKGSSLIAIKKYLATNYKVDPVKHGHFIKKALASGVEKKTIVQVKGIGASGSFKLAKVEAKPKKAVKPKASSKKPKTPTKKVPKTKPAASKKATPKKKAEKSKATKSAAKPKKPVAKKSKPSRAPARKAAPKKK